MKPNQTDDELRRLFAREAGAAVSPAFTAQLIDTLHRERLFQQPNESLMAKWLGRVTIGVALASNALVLSRVDLFAASPEVVCAVFAFVVGSCTAAAMMKKLSAV